MATKMTSKKAESSRRKAQKLYAYQTENEAFFWRICSLVSSKHPIWRGEFTECSRISKDPLNKSKMGEYNACVKD
jgi:hypothetical protein